MSSPSPPSSTCCCHRSSVGAYDGPSRRADDCEQCDQGKGDSPQSGKFHDEGTRSMNDSMQLRLRLIGVVIVSLMAALVARLWFLQSIENDELRSIAEGNLLKEVLIPASRGLILDAQGRPLVTNKRVTVVSIDLAELDRVLPANRRDSKRLDMLTRLAKELSSSGRLTKVADLEAAIEASGLTNIGKVTVATDVSPE